MGALGHSLDTVSGWVQPVSSTFKQGNTQVLPPAPQETTPLVPGRFQKPATLAEQAAIQAAVTRAWVEHQGRGHGASPAQGTPRPARGRSTGSPRQAASPQGLSPWCQLLHFLVTKLPREQSPWTCHCQPLREPGWPPQRLSRRDSFRRFSSRDRVVSGTPGAPAQWWSGPPLTASSKKLTSSWLQWGGGKSLPGTTSKTWTTPNGLTRPSPCASPVPSWGAPKSCPNIWTSRGTTSGNISGEGPPHCATAPQEPSTVLHQCGSPGHDPQLPVDWGGQGVPKTVAMLQGSEVRFPLSPYPKENAV